MKVFLIILLSVLIGVSSGMGYFAYKKFYSSNELILEQNEAAPAPKTFNYQIPVANIKNQSLSTSSQSSQKKQSNVSRDYLIYYENSINNFNKISNSLKNLQQFLGEIEQKYKNNDYSTLPFSISKANNENLNFNKIVSDLKNSFNSWSAANKNSVDELIQSKTNQVIEVGFNYTQSSFNFSKAVDGILAYKGTGDFNRLSGELQEAAQKMTTDGKKFNELFNELNNVLNL